MSIEAFQIYIENLPFYKIYKENMEMMPYYFFEDTLTYFLRDAIKIYGIILVLIFLGRAIGLIINSISYDIDVTPIVMHIENPKGYFFEDILLDFIHKCITEYSLQISNNKNAIGVTSVLIILWYIYVSFGYILWILRIKWVLKNFWKVVLLSLILISMAAASDYTFSIIIVDVIQDWTATRSKLALLRCLWFMFFFPPTTIWFRFLSPKTYTIVTLSYLALWSINFIIIRLDHIVKIYNVKGTLIEQILVEKYSFFDL